MKTNDWLLLGIVGLAAYGLYVFNKKAVVQMPSDVADLSDKEEAEENFNYMSGKMKQKMRQRVKKLSLNDIVKGGGSVVGIAASRGKKVVKKVKQKINKG